MTEQMSVQNFILIKDFLDDLVQKDLATKEHYIEDVRYKLPHPSGYVEVLLDDKRVHIMPPSQTIPEGFIAPYYVTYRRMAEELYDHYENVIGFLFILRS